MPLFYSTALVGILSISKRDNVGSSKLAPLQRQAYRDSKYTSKKICVSKVRNSNGINACGRSATLEAARPRQLSFGGTGGFADAVRNSPFLAAKAPVAWRGPLRQRRPVAAKAAVEADWHGKC